MRKVMLAICVLGLLPSLASADVIGSWALDTGLPGFDRWILTVTPTANEVMAGFDLGLFDTAGSGPFENNGLPFGAAKGTAVVGSNTQFFGQLSHGSGPTAKTDITQVGTGVDSDDLFGAFGFAAGGIYDQGNGVIGWTGVHQLLVLVTPTTGDPFSVDRATGTLNGLGFMNNNFTTPGVWLSPDTAKHEIMFVGVPEPSTVALLGCGLFGLLAYAWRKRK